MPELDRRNLDERNADLARDRVGMFLAVDYGDTDGVASTDHRRKEIHGHR